MTSLRKAGPQPAAFKLDLPVEHRRHHGTDKFIVTALWLVGFSAGDIARTSGLRRTQILGIVYRSGFEMRSTMSDDERQEAIVELFDSSTAEQRAALPGFDWTIRPIEDGRQRRPARKAKSS